MDFSENTRVLEIRSDFKKENYSSKNYAKDCFNYEWTLVTTKSLFVEVNCLQT
jgi:hypothetical protein